MAVFLWYVDLIDRYYLIFTPFVFYSILLFFHASTHVVCNNLDTFWSFFDTWRFTMKGMNTLREHAIEAIRVICVIQMLIRDIVCSCHSIWVLRMTWWWALTLSLLRILNESLPIARWFGSTTTFIIALCFVCFCQILTPDHAHLSRSIASKMVLWGWSRRLISLDFLGLISHSIYTSPNIGFYRH